ncbi:ABC transporter permease [Rhodocytophaga aerolata]|uniref:ABC transporter permease n=1 Tax=Rhodocytophaga aerolata TaxID=455078 RepID=A0ABT8RBF1_9BACT|nr:ABC transporter permease [Rhodocytophaga aerolata]MDO1449448.1 ABC transporter permease [Rhodocytophaga aerolata]
MNASIRPPKWADQLLAWFCAPHLLEEIQGDLHERYHKQRQERGKAAADAAYVGCVLSFIRPFTLKRKSPPYIQASFTDMLQNYFIIALRHMKRNKVFSTINIAGLSVGLACCMLIFLYTKDEVSFDRFHEKKDRIFRVSATLPDPEGNVFKTGSTNMIVGPSLQQEIPEMEAYVRMSSDRHVIRVVTKTFNQQTLWVDQNFFSVFSFPLLSGNPDKVLSDIRAVVITEQMALTYFGTSKVVGKTIELEMGETFEPFTVTGVAKNTPQNSSIQFDLLFPYQYIAERFPDKEWLGFYINTFVVLHPQAQYQTVEPKLDQVFMSKATEELKRAQQNGFKGVPHFGLQPLLQIHLDTEYGDIRNGLQYGSNPMYSYILSGIAIFILLIACINFINLTTAHSLKRSKEIGIRKVVGGNRGQLIRQFLNESFVCCFIAFVLALLMVVLVLPFFNELANKRLSFSYLLDGTLAGAYLGLFLLTGLIAGFYPAFVLSGFNPIQSLSKRYTFSGKNYLTKGLVIAQFSLAAFLMIVTIVVYSQFDYLTTKDLGYTDEHLVHVSLGRGDHSNLVNVFKNELANEASVERVASKDFGQNFTIAEVEGKELFFAFSRIDENYLPTLQIPLAKGRNFSKNYPADAENSIVVNETFVKEAGWKDPIGKTVYNVNGNAKNLTVIGVVKDYHFLSLKEKIQPLLFRLGTGDLWIKLKPAQTLKGLQAIEQTYHKLVPYRPFEFAFMDEVNRKNYEAEAKWKQIITVAAMLSIFVSCIGLFGLTILSTERRTREIGIRKVFGASASQIATLLSAHFIKLVLFSFVMAVPAAWYSSRTWLENFAYQIDVSWWMFALAGVLILVIALATVSVQAIKASIINPASSLRSE